MKQLHLIRMSRNTDETIGILVHDYQQIGVTLELPWRSNAVGKSSIPEGSYRCSWVRSPRFGYTYEVRGVPGRTDILLHPGNTHIDTTGCILLGKDVRGGVLFQSRDAIDDLHSLVSPDAFMLHIWAL